VVDERKFDIIDKRKSKKKTAAKFPAFTPKLDADGICQNECLFLAQREYLIALSKKYGNYTNVCRLAGISQSQMNGWIAGRHLMGIDKIKQLETMLGQRYDEIRYPTFLRRYW
jgi:hypothetical protein